MGVQYFLDFIGHVVDGVRGLLDGGGSAASFLRYLVGVATVLGGLSLLVACFRLFGRGLYRRLYSPDGGLGLGYSWSDPAVQAVQLNKKILGNHFRGGGGDVKAQFMGFPADGEVYAGGDEGIGFSAEHLQSFFDYMPPIFRETIRYVNFPDSWDADSVGLPEELFDPHASGFFVSTSQTIHIDPWLREVGDPDKVDVTLFHEALHSYEYAYGTVAANSEYYEYLKGLEGGSVEGINMDPDYYNVEEFVAQSYALYKVHPDDTYSRTPMTYAAMGQLDTEILSRSISS